MGFFVQKERVDICLIQETKMQVLFYSLVAEMWRDLGVQWSYISSCDRSGGLLITWRVGYCELISSFCGDEFLGNNVLRKQY